MIFSFGINIFLNLVNWLLTPLENINWNININFIEPLINFFKVIFYLLPIENLRPLFIIVIIIIGLKYFISALKTVMDIIPFV